MQQPLPDFINKARSGTRLKPKPPRSLYKRSRLRAAAGPDVRLLNLQAAQSRSSLYPAGFLLVVTLLEAASLSVLL